LHAAVFASDDHSVLFANEWLARILDRPHAPAPEEIAARFPITVTGMAGLTDTPAHLPFTGHEVRDSIDGRWYLAQAGAITWTDGRRVRLTVLTDITEQKRAAALRRENQAALHHTARLVNLAEAGTTLAHELNQPLVAIVGYNSACLRMLDSGNADPSELATAMEKCRAQAVRAGDILRRIRELTRKRAPTLAPNDVNATLRKVLAWVEDELERDGVRVSFELDPALPRAQADAILVEQVVLNLVNNAVDAMRNMPPGQRELLIQTAAEERNAVRVTVADRGAGIAPEHEAHLFTPFFTTKERGLGLGLSICRSVLEMHGGRLWHDNRPDGGAAFHFSLPTGAP
jgi:C4-dicarboxylate-specific signal transduction histidine kinase